MRTNDAVALFGPVARQAVTRDAAVVSSAVTLDIDRGSSTVSGREILDLTVERGLLLVLDHLLLLLLSLEDLLGGRLLLDGSGRELREGGSTDRRDGVTERVDGRGGSDRLDSSMSPDGRSVVLRQVGSEGRKVGKDRSSVAECLSLAEKLSLLALKILDLLLESDLERNST
jgi:hypothetical protein